jgi:hypothetical protein
MPFLHGVRTDGRVDTTENRTRDDFERGTPKGLKFEERSGTAESDTGVKDQGARRLLRLRKERTMATASEEEAGDRIHVWKARRHYVRLADKLTSSRSQSK